MSQREGQRGLVFKADLLEQNTAHHAVRVRNANARNTRLKTSWNMIDPKAQIRLISQTTKTPNDADRRGELQQRKKSKDSYGNRTLDLRIAGQHPQPLSHRASWSCSR